MHQVKVSVQLHPQQATIDEFREAWLRADELGVDGIFTWDHFFPLYGDRDGPSFEAWTLLAGLGVLTGQAEIGCLVHSISYRNPALLSKMATTLDLLLGGRLILGLGAGWSQRDYQEFDYDYGTAGQRLKALERGIEIIEARWAKDSPRPPRETIPILIGGGGEKVTLRIAAQHADIWHAFGDPERWAAKSRVLDEWCSRVGRDPGQIERSASIEGRPNRLDDYVKVGATHLICNLGAPFDMGPVREMLSWRDARRRSDGAGAAAGGREQGAG